MPFLESSLSLKQPEYLLERGIPKARACLCSLLSISARNEGEEMAHRSPCQMLRATVPRDTAAVRTVKTNEGTSQQGDQLYQQTGGVPVHYHQGCPGKVWCWGLNSGPNACQVCVGSTIELELTLFWSPLMPCILPLETDAMRASARD